MRAVVVVLVAMVNVTVPLFVPLDAESVAHALSEVAVHAAFEVTVTVFVSPAAATLVNDAGATESLGAVPGCVI